MNDIKCPYCGAEWEYDSDDLSYTEKKGEYECPACERIFIMSGELKYVFFEETAEDYYEREILDQKCVVAYYKEKIELYIEYGENDNAEYYKNMIDMYEVPQLRELEKALERCVEHNKKVGEGK